MILVILLSVSLSMEFVETVQADVFKKIFQMEFAIKPVLMSNANGTDRTVGVFKAVLA